MFRKLGIEHFEKRLLLSVTVTENAIVTDHDLIPRMDGVDIRAVKDGVWSDPQTWGGRLPHADENVLIGEHVDVVFDTTAQVADLEVSGRLRFAPEAVTQLTVDTIYVMPSGVLQIGTSQSPILASSHLVFADHAIDTVSDPLQFGNGLIVFGTFETDGRDVTPSIRAAADIHAGDQAVLLDSVPLDWAVGDQIILPGTSQRTKRGQDLESETAVIASIDGNRLILENPVEYDHFGISENPFGIEVFPHVGNLTRNIVLRSENPEGVRGHTLSAGLSQTIVRDVAFEGLGRTSGVDRLDSTVLDANGNVTHQGTNQVARYPVHAHHLHEGHRFDLIQSVIVDSPRWAVAIHDTSDSNIVGNVIYDVDGGGIVTEDGTEQRNRLAGNLIVQVNGGHGEGDRRGGGRSHDFGTDGSGIWLRMASGTIENNAVYDAVGYGYNINGYGLGFTPMRGVHSQFDLFQGNEVASSRGGIWLTWSQGQARLDQYERLNIVDTLVWHVRQDGVHSYHEANYRFENLTVVGDPAVSAANEGANFNFEIRSTTGVFQGFSSYENWNMIFDGLQVSGVNTAVAVTGNAGSEGTLIRDSALEAYVKLAVDKDGDFSSVALDNVRFLPSRTGRISKAFPEQPANIWQEGVGVIETGQLADGVAPGLVAKPQSSLFARRNNSEIVVKGTSGNDEITVDQTDQQYIVLFNGETFRFDRQGVRAIQVYAGDGDDLVTANVDTVVVRLYGQQGDDTLIGGGGPDKIVGGAGNDIVDGRGGIDFIWRRLGDDEVVGSLEQDQVVF